MFDEWKSFFEKLDRSKITCLYNRPFPTDSIHFFSTESTMKGRQVKKTSVMITQIALIQEMKGCRVKKKTFRLRPRAPMNQ